MNNQTKKLHAVLQEILDYVVAVCEKEGLHYVLAYGTALGAYRHHDFIPWDDDLDIAMPRDDYDKLITYMNTYPSDRYVIQNEENEENYFLSFAKVRKKGTVFIESITTQIYRENGAYIDIFPLDYIDDPSSLRTKITNIRILYWKHALKFISCRDLYREKFGIVRYILDNMLCIPANVVGMHKALKKMHSLMKQNGSTESQYLAEYSEAIEKAILPKDIYFPACQMEFASKQYAVPNNIQAYLCAQYGDDFMELPPVEKRQTHNPIRLELN